MKCIHCGSEVRNGAKFCRECGAEIVEKTETLNTNMCPVCGSLIEYDAIFCNECGTRLAETTETTEDLTDNVIICSCCGNRLKAEALFCGKCGNAINQGQLKTTIRNDENVKKKDKGLIFLIVLLVAVLIGCAITIGYVYYQNNPVSTTTSDFKKESKNNEEKTDKDEENLESGIEKNTDDEIEPGITDDKIIDEQEEVFLFPSDKEYITISDLYGRSQEEVALIRNEIYARHGYVFNTEPFKSYFEAKDWYIPDPSFSDSVFNDIEKTNKDFLVNYETEKGWR